MEQPDLDLLVLLPLTEMVMRSLTKCGHIPPYLFTCLVNTHLILPRGLFCFYEVTFVVIAAS